MSIESGLCESTSPSCPLSKDLLAIPAAGAPEIKLGYLYLGRKNDTQGTKWDLFEARLAFGDGIVRRRRLEGRFVGTIIWSRVAYNWDGI